MFRCLDGYHGDPREGIRQPCRPCMCPGGPDHPAQHADGCYYDPRLEYIVCQCEIGYRGNTDVGIYKHSLSMLSLSDNHTY